MEQCLVTKLKGNVDNRSLKKLGFVRIYFHEGVETDSGNRKLNIYTNQQYTTFKSTHDLNLYGSDATTLVYQGKEANQVNSGDAIYLEFPDAEGYVDIYTDYKLSYIGYWRGHFNFSKPVPWTFDGEELQYQPIDQMHGRVDMVQGEYKPNSILKTLGVYANNIVSGMVFNINDMTDQADYLWNANNKNCRGNISYLGNFLKLGDIRLYGTNCIGDAKTMLDGMVTAGKTSGSIQMKLVNGKITWNGDVLTNSKIQELTGTSKDTFTATFSGSGYTLS